MLTYPAQVIADRYNSNSEDFHNLKNELSEFSYLNGVVFAVSTSPWDRGNRTDAVIRVDVCREVGNDPDTLICQKDFVPCYSVYLDHSGVLYRHSYKHRTPKGTTSFLGLLVRELKKSLRVSSGIIDGEIIHVQK